MFAKIQKLGSLFVGMFFALIIFPLSFAVAEDSFFGLQIQGLSEQISDAIGFEGTNGVLVRDVAYPGPASHSNIRRGDVIVEMDGKKVTGFEAVVKMAQGFQPDTKVPAKLFRRGKIIEVSIPIGKRPPEWGILRNNFATLAPVGLTLAAMTDKVKERFNLPWHTRGVVVSLVDKEKASKLDVREGDVILQVNQSPVWKPAHVLGFIKKANREKKTTVLMLIERSDGYRFVMLPISGL